MKSYNAKALQMPKLPGPVVQSVASLTADPGVLSSIPARSHTYSLPLIQEGLLQAKYVHEELVNCLTILS